MFSRVALADLLRDVWTQSYAPHDWHHASLVPVPKKSDLRQCDNSRGIALLVVESFAAESLRILGPRQRNWPLFFLASPL